MDDRKKWASATSGPYELSREKLISLAITGGEAWSIDEFEQPEPSRPSSAGSSLGDWIEYRNVRPSAEALPEGFVEPAELHRFRREAQWRELTPGMDRYSDLRDALSTLDNGDERGWFGSFLWSGCHPKKTEQVDSPVTMGAKRKGFLGVPNPFAKWVLHYFTQEPTNSAGADARIEIPVDQTPKAMGVFAVDEGGVLLAYSYNRWWSCGEAIQFTLLEAQSLMTSSGAPPQLSRQ
jgi:hypothetical protein